MKEVNLKNSRQTNGYGKGSKLYRVGKTIHWCVTGTKLVLISIEGIAFYHLVTNVKYVEFLALTFPDHLMECNILFLSAKRILLVLIQA